MEPELSPHPNRKEAPFILWMGAAGALFAVLGGLGAATDPWRADESSTYSMAMHPLGEMLRRTAERVHPPFFYLLMLGWERIWSAPHWMQVLTLLIGLATVWLAGLIGRQLGSRATGVVASMLMATCPVFVHGSQDARMYGLALLLEMTAVEGWILSARLPRTGWILFVAGLTLANYTHNHCLVFGFFFIALEGLRCLLARRPGASGWTWIVTAALAVAILYLPWAPTLLRQMHFPYIAREYEAPLLSKTLWTIFFTSYSLHPLEWKNAIDWLPGCLLFGVFPVAALLAKRDEPQHPSRPLWMICAAAFAPLAFLWCYSNFHQPVLAISRQGMLFLPLLLIPAAMLVRHSKTDSGRPHWLLLCLFALLGLNAVEALKDPRDPSIDLAANAVLEHAPLGAPLLNFPANFDEHHLEFSPLPMLNPLSAAAIPERLTSCTLLVTPGDGEDREFLLSRCELLFSQAASVKRVYASYYLSAYALQGLPDGAVRALFNQEAGGAEDIWTQSLGRWPVEKSWTPQELSTAIGGKVQPVTMRLGRSSMRLEKRQISFKLTPGALPAGSYRAICFAGDAVGKMKSIGITMSVGGRPPQEFKVQPGRFVLAQCLDPGDGPIDISLSLPDSMAQPLTSLKNYAAQGVYLLGACVVQLRPQDFRREGSPGEFIDVGALGDSIFMRPDCFEREGIPSNNSRWTGQRFEFEAPVWEGQSVQEVTLRGFLPAEIAARTMKLEVDPKEIASGQAPSTSQTKSAESPGPASYGAAVFKLPRPLAPGIHRFRVGLGGVYVPAEHGAGQDDRALGFNLDGIELN